jgi:hypothetical protein
MGVYHVEHCCQQQGVITLDEQSRLIRINRISRARSVAEVWPWFLGLRRTAGTRDITDRLYLVLPVAILGLGAFLRLWQVNALGYNSDEAVYAGQAAAMAADPALKEIFPIFRAHPLLFQFVMALTFSFGVNDLAGRLVSVGVGLATICLVYWLGTLLYGRRAGLLAMLFMALMPYHVIVSRQVLLDGPMTLCATLTLYLVARYAVTRHPGWLYAAGAGMGLTFLSKETGIILLGAIYAFLALSPEIRVRLRDLAGFMVSMILVIAPFPISLALAGGEGTQKAQSYLIWKLFRRPNHTWDFYLTTVPDAIGPLLIVAALSGCSCCVTSGRGASLLLLVDHCADRVLSACGQPRVPLFAGRCTCHRRPGRTHAEPVGTQEGAGTGAPWLEHELAAGGARQHHCVDVAAAQLAGNPIVQLHSVSGGFGWGVRRPRDRAVARCERAERSQTDDPGALHGQYSSVLWSSQGLRPVGQSEPAAPAIRRTSRSESDLQMRSGDLQYIVWDSFSAARSPFFSEKMLGMCDATTGEWFIPSP